VIMVFRCAIQKVFCLTPPPSHYTRSRNLAARCRGCSLATRAGRLYLDYLADGAATRHHPPLPDADEAGGGWDQMLLSAWSD
jgi:hypothetical protein